MKKNVTLILALGSLAASAAVPLHWTVESSRTSLAQLEAYHGETLDIAATMQTYGKPLSLDGKTAVLYYQTNGMEQAWWSVNGTCSGSTARVTFTPAMDPGASILNLFLSVQDGGNNYRAHARLKMLGSPGADAHVIEPPIVTLDFSRIGLILNAPYYTKAEADGLIDDKADKTNTYTKAETEQKIQELAPTTEETDPVYNEDKPYLCTIEAAEQLVANHSTLKNNPHEVTAQQAFSKNRNVSATAYFTGFAGFNGQVQFDEDSSVSFYSIPHFREAFDTNTLRNATGGIGFTSITPESSRMAANGIIHTPEAGNSAEIYDLFYAFPLRSGMLALLSDIPTVPSWAQSPNKPTYTPDEVGAYTKEEVDGLVADAGKVKTVAGQEPDASGNVSLSPSTIGAATQEEVNAAMTAANDANVWSSATFNFMTGGRTNCWFSGTNYVFGTDAAARTRFAWEDGMDAATLPCSMALWEIRDGVRQLVWDQRDWTAWYWSFKANQMQTNVTAQIAALGLAVTNDSNYAWAKRYASDGTPNPDASTTFIDTPSVTLSPGMKWETVATVSGAAYWTIVGDGAIIGGSGTNAVLRIQDFEGNDIMTVTKGEHRLAWIERGEITGQMYDGDGWVCFDMLADAEPIGYFSTTLDSSDFLPQTDPNCPAQYEWEDLHNGKYRIHYLLKPGIQSNACFAKFQVEVEGQTIIRYNAGQEISGGLIYNGVKIAPDISGSPAVGTVIQWKVVH